MAAWIELTHKWID